MKNQKISNRPAPGAAGASAARLGFRLAKGMKDDNWRNDPCPCGSGKKFKKCCAAKGGTTAAGFPVGIRMKGGVRFDPAANAYRAIVHSWDNAACIGEPQEWRTPETFESEDAAMAFYKASIRPRLERLMAEASRRLKGGTFMHRRLE